MKLSRTEAHRWVCRLWRESWTRSLTEAERANYISIQQALVPTLSEASIVATIGRKPNPYALRHDGLDPSDYGH